MMQTVPLPEHQHDLEEDPNDIIMSSSTSCPLPEHQDDLVGNGLI